MVLQSKLDLGLFGDNGVALQLEGIVPNFVLTWW